MKLSFKFFHLIISAFLVFGSAQPAQSNNSYLLSGDILIRGSNVEGNNVILNAKNEINIVSAQEYESNRSKDKSSSGSIGATISNAGIGATLSASKTKGHSNSDSVTNVDSTVTANNLLISQSGGDTNIKGAQVKGDTVILKAGKDLNIESRQDSVKADMKYKSIGGSVTIGPAPGGSANYQASNSNE